MEKIGKIIKNISNLWTIEVDGVLYPSKASGKVRNANVTPLVGDMVVFDDENNYILKILPRKNSLIRPTVSNVDQVLIIVSVKEPNLDLYLLDKLLLIAEFNNLIPVICFTKLDLLSDLDYINNIRKYYEKIGYRCVYNNEIDDFESILKDKTTVLTGQSGAGKSSLLNKFNPEFKLATNEISKSLNRGKHTTRHTQLYNIFSGYVVDTPGFSSIDITSIKLEYIKENMKELFDNSHNCFYKDCAHINENKCCIKQMVEDGQIMQSRYDNYLKFIKQRGDDGGKVKY